jgi:hypothetical protein
MKSIRNSIYPALVAIAFAYFALAPTAPPDGGYSGGNTAGGQNALFSLMRCSVAGHTQLNGYPT